MARVYRIDITKQNCWMCDHFRRNDTGDPNEGSCTANAPRARGGFPGGTSGEPQNNSGAAIAEPLINWCGQFKQWPGTPRVVEGG